ncbi:MAG: hypothetical protein LBR73_07985 [Oscillospiraceae bacterium]|nr:hypothetical protein [Oscillospiraceae bacterium]
MAKEKLTPEEKERLKFEKEREAWRKREAAGRKRKKGAPDKTKIIASIISIVLAAVVVCSIGYIYGKSYGLPGRFLTATSLEGDSISAPEYAFFFYNQYYNVAYQAEQFMSSYGLDLMQLDTTKSPWGQASPYGMQWPTYLKKQTDASVLGLLAMIQAAEKAGITLSDADKAAVESQIDELKATAQSYGMSYGAFLRLNYTAGITPAKYKKILEREKIIAAYEEKLKADYGAAHTDAELQEEYDKDPAAYNSVSVRILTFTKDTLTAAEGESDDALAKRQETADKAVVAEAKTFTSKVSSEDSFLKAAAEENSDIEGYDADSATGQFLVQKDDLSSFGTDVTDWIFNKSRKAGDKTTIEGTSSVYCIYMIQPAYAPLTVDFYTVDYAFPSPADGVANTEEEKAQTKEQADATLQQWKDSGATEEAFKELAAAAHSAEEDVEEDHVHGFYPATSPSDITDNSVKKWLFDKSRKDGETAIVETSTGYAVFYFVRQNTSEPAWLKALREEKSETDYDAYYASLTSGTGEGAAKLNENRLGIYFAMKTAQNMVENYVRNSASSAG